MKGTKYEDNKGRTVTVVGVEDNIVSLNNGERVALERLQDPRYYNPVSQPNIQLNNKINENVMSNAPILTSDEIRYKRLVDGLQTNKSTAIGMNVDDDVQLRHVGNSNSAPNTQIYMGGSVVENHRQKTHDFDDDDGGDMMVVKPFVQQRPPVEIEERQEVVQKQLTPEEALLQKYGHVAPQNESLAVSNNKLAALAGEPLMEVPTQRQQPIVSQPQMPMIQQPVKNPLHIVFEEAKKTHPLELTLKLKEKIPNKENLKILDSIFDEVSAVDYYASYIFKILMENPEIIEDQIKEAIVKYMNGTKK